MVDAQGQDVVDVILWDAGYAAIAMTAEEAMARAQALIDAAGEVIARRSPPAPPAERELSEAARNGLTAADIGEGRPCPGRKPRTRPTEA